MSLCVCVSRLYELLTQTYSSSVQVVYSVDVVFVDGGGTFRCPEIWDFLFQGDLGRGLQ
jgi:hypothetical protein